MLKLCDEKDGRNGVWLVAPKVTIGRGSNCDLTLADPSVAKMHAEIVVDGESLELRNLAGSGFVAVNGKLVDGCCALKRNDKVQLGERNLVVIDPKTTRLKSAGASANVSWALRANHPAIAGRVYPVRENSVVGRSDECDLTFAMSHLSRRHARLEIRDGLLFAVDLGSANGTYLNNQRISESRVRRGDELRFDTLSFSVVGPADDLDKTTVRQAISLPEASVSEAELEPALSRERLRDVAEEEIPGAEAVVDSLEMSSEASGGFGKLLLGLVLIGAAAGYFWARNQGLL